MRRAGFLVWLLIFLLLLEASLVSAAQVHYVSNKDSLYKISEWYGVDVPSIARTNNLEAPYTIYPGQVVIVPDPVARPGEIIYRVKAGDSLYSIAKAHGLSKDELMSYNKLASELIYSGQALRLPTKPQPSAVRTLAAAYSASTYYYNIPDLMKAYPARIFLRGQAQDKVVALTFDDGPDPVFTPQILDVLAYHGVPATFFVRGDRVAQYPQVVQRMIQEGHVVGGHSWSHPNLRSLSADRIRWQVENTAKEIKKWTGLEPKLMRPPYGEMSEEGMAELASMDNYLINWSADSNDWQAKGRDDVLIGAIPGSKPGAIVLMHSAGGVGQSLQPTIDALPYFIYTLRVQGYKFVTVDKLLGTPAYKS